MKKGTKVMAALVAISLLAPAQVWADQNNHEQAKENWKKEQQLLMPGMWNPGQKQDQAFPTLHSNQLFTKSKSSAKLQMNKPLMQQLDGKKKSVSIKSVPKDMKNSLDNVYKIFHKLKDMKLVHAEILFESDEYPELWGFDFAVENKKGRIDQRASVAIVANDGTVLHYYYDDSNAKPGKAPTEKEAKDQASVFLEKVLGKKASQYVIDRVSIYHDREDEEEDTGEARVDFLRTINGIPFDGRGVGLYVNGDGDINGYFCNYDTFALKESDFPDPKKAIQPGEVKSHYLKLIDMNLAYRNEQIVEYNEKTDEIKTKPVLKYVPSFIGAMDAITGKKATIFDSKDEVKPENIKLQPEGKVLSASDRAEAEAVLKSQFKIDVTGWEYDQNSDDEDQDTRSSEYLQYNWNLWDKEHGEEVFLMANKKTNQVLAYSHNIYKRKKEDQKVISKEEAKKIALDTFQTFAKTSMNEAQLSLAMAPMDEQDLPSWVDKEKLPNNWNTDNYLFFLNELYQGVPIDDSGYAVVVDAHSGEVREIAFADNSIKLALPDNKGTVSATKAKTALGNNLMFDAVYEWPNFYGQKTPEPMLIYGAIPHYDGYIDAFTGKLVRVKINK
ncbi:YcdB/YcdC domain-containing protein [Brevibacillus ginsengisoli]|uniref:YcdB/YcdC domain-containing protein n=1 Tax=Brevibacillus ginsengisoli TaxID=363854 RepID=UPI003CF578E0